MRLIKISLRNIKNMFTHKTVIAVLLILGIIVSSCALNVYVSQSVSMSKAISGYSTVERALEYKGGTLSQTGYAVLAKYISENADNIAFYCTMNMEYEDIDIIGINAAKAPFTPDTGEWVSPGNVIVPYQAGYEVGDTYLIGDKSYNVCGVYSSVGYSGDYYSSKRMTIVDYSAAGVTIEQEFLEYDPENPYNSQDIRESYGVFMSFEDFVLDGYYSDTFRIMFNNAISPSAKQEYSAKLMEYYHSITGMDLIEESVAMEAAAQVYGFEFISKFIVYIVISIISFINTLSLFAYVLKQNKYESLTYISLGATRGKMLFVTALETIIYIIPAYTIGFFLAKLLINVTDLKENMSYFGFKQYIIILVCMLIIALVYVLIYQYILLKNRKKASEPLFSFKGFAKLGWKNAYLTFKNYSAGILSEIIILLQVVLVAFSFSYVGTFIFQRGANDRLIDRMFGGQQVYYCGYNNQFFDSLWGQEEDYMYTLVTVPEGEAAIKCVENMEGVEGFSTVSTIDFIYNEEIQQYVKEHKTSSSILDVWISAISPYYIENVRTIKLQEGQWLDEWADGLEITTAEYIPIVVSESFLKNTGAKCGDILNDFVLSDQYSKKDSIGLTPVWDGDTFLYYDTSPYETVTFKIVGVLDPNSTAYSEGIYPPVVENTFPTVDKYLDIHNTSAIYCPILFKDGELYFGNFPRTGGILIYTDGTKDIEYYREAYSEFGPVWDMKDLAEEFDGYYLDGTSEYSVHLYITVALLFIGVAGYNLLSVERNKKTYGIYYSCGMPWKRSMTITVIANSIIFILGGIIGTIWGIVGAGATRTMAEDTVTLTAASSMGFILLLFVISTISVFAQMSKLTPIALIKKK